MRVLLFLVSFILFSFKQDGNDEIVWQADKKLEWKYFKASPNPDSKHSAISASRINMSYHSKKDTLFVSVRAVFIQSESWVVSGNETESLLSHEQTHFDITELYARKLRQKISGKKMKKISVMKELTELKNDIGDNLNAFHDLYDSETNHCKNAQKQLEWEKKIAKELQSLDAFKNTELKILLIKD
jgi:hypothetical protein